MEDESGQPNVIIDNGSGYIKAGLSGEEKPKVFFPNCVGDGALIGEEALEEKFGKVIYPIEHGIIKDFDIMEKIWDRVFTKELNVAPSEHNVLLTEALLNQPKNREMMAQIMFESFYVSGLYIALQPILSIYAAGKFNGMVVELGEDISQFVPIVDCFASKLNYNYLDLGGRDLSDYLIRLIENTGTLFSSRYRKKVAYQLKEKGCYVALDFEDELKFIEPFDYELPDNTHIVLKEQRICCPEALFRPSMIGKEADSISQICLNSINKYKKESERIDFYNCIILSGGCSMFNGLPERLTKEIKALAPETMKEEVKVIASPERNFYAWRGGSILSSISTFDKMWITKTEYEESGAYIINSKLA